MIHIRQETPADGAAREALLDAAFGASRFSKTSERLRAGRLPATGLAFVAVAAHAVVGTLRLWHVSAGPGCPALLLGPLAVDPARRNQGFGSTLVRHAIAAAHQLGHAAILLVGDAAYYGRFGFTAEKTAGLRMPGPYEPERLLALELRPGALDGARGLMSGTGARAPAPRRRARVASAKHNGQRPAPQAA